MALKSQLISPKNNQISKQNSLKLEEKTIKSPSNDEQSPNQIISSLQKHYYQKYEKIFDKKKNSKNNLFHNQTLPNLKYKKILNSDLQKQINTQELASQFHYTSQNQSVRKYYNFKEIIEHPKRKALYDIKQQREQKIQNLDKSKKNIYFGLNNVMKDIEKVQKSSHKLKDQIDEQDQEQIVSQIHDKSKQNKGNDSPLSGLLNSQINDKNNAKSKENNNASNLQKSNKQNSLLQSKNNESKWNQLVQENDDSISLRQPEETSNRLNVQHDKNSQNNLKMGLQIEETDQINPQQNQNPEKQQSTLMINYNDVAFDAEMNSNLIPNLISQQHLKNQMQNQNSVNQTSNSNILTHIKRIDKSNQQETTNDGLEEGIQINDIKAQLNLNYHKLEQQQQPLPDGISINYRSNSKKISHQKIDVYQVHEIMEEDVQTNYQKYQQKQNQ
ncbi:hypothetical protein PPERSA_08350 [Pseudocohnilembus persalinus]|uniref:Uncharacterized protein n=1 Tax=Pseudocohnilembus persalinus TaxID=266149 RepID=A0A0V0QPX7_PSEPJ|nr:hypothetical protein PPERSA_08350 [Pseudocohnilembus persalinus]|eukprot:KRX04135.1 hypothetical protein PPERSA_08350 [Pseudocohnilembus persalinus]